jgi:hypothetical protein
VTHAQRLRAERAQIIAELNSGLSPYAARYHLLYALAVDLRTKIRALEKE